MTEDKRSIIQMVTGLIEQGKKNQNKIAYSKILDTFSGVEITSEQFDNILKVLEDNKIEVLRSKNDMEQAVSLSGPVGRDCVLLGHGAGRGRRLRLFQV